MPSVLIIAPNFHYFAQSITSAFEQLGWQAHCETYDTPIHPYNHINRIRFKIENKNRLKELSRLHYKTYIEQVFNTLQPHLVFIVNGDNLLPETVQYMQQKTRVAVWCFDSVHRLPLVLDNLPYADSVFCYEQEDIAYLQEKMNISAIFLPQAVDTNLYYPMHTSKNLDIVFAGDIWQSQKRQHIIQNIIAHYPHLKIRIWGIYKPWYKGIWQWLTRERRDIYTNRNANVETLNRDYNRAQIVLNIHHEQQHNGANPKVFEICATGAYQICDANPYIEQLFHNDEIGLYHNEQELFTLIDYALAHDMTMQSQAAYNIVIQQHTFIQRMKNILDIMELTTSGDSRVDIETLPRG